MQQFERIAPDTLRIERVLDAAPETVWRWLTDPTLRRRWFAAGTAADHEGPFDLEFDHDELSDGEVPYPPEYAKYKGSVSHERVLTVEAPRRLSWTWGGGKEGRVTFELFPENGNRTRLVLTHSGISGPPAFANFGSGWLAHLATLERRIAGHEVPDFWALFADAQRTVDRTVGAAP
jgi:uncharacterized protein YndB with AHSA1/START domain